MTTTHTLAGDRDAPAAPEPIDILLVDDNPGKLLALQAALTPLGENLVTATSGRAALLQILERDFAVIILDVNMPDVSGFETARMIRSRARTARTPIVFVSAISLEHSDALQGYSLGAVDYIVTPIVPEILRAKVAVFADLHRKTVEARTHAARLKERTEELEKSQRELRMAERMATIGTLCAGLGHDMGNLLLPISVWTDTLDERALPEDSREAVESLRTCVSYLRRLSSGLRQLALDPSAELGEPETEMPSWREEIEPILRNAVPRGVTIAYAIADDLPRVRIARHQLTQVAFNLVQNAGEAMRKRGSGSIVISAEYCPRRSTIRMRVADDGPGMPPEVAARCFDPYFTTKTRGMSTGLGLALVDGIVRRCGGSVSVQSSERGTTFEILAPAVDRSGQSRPLAVVELSEPRIRGYATGILKLAGFAMSESVPDGYPGKAVYVTDATDRDWSSFVGGRSSRKVFVLSDRRPDQGGVEAFSFTPGVASLREQLQRFVRSKE